MGIETINHIISKSNFKFNYLSNGKVKTKTREQTLSKLMKFSNEINAKKIIYKSKLIISVLSEINFLEIEFAVFFAQNIHFPINIFKSSSFIKRTILETQPDLIIVDNYRMYDKIKSFFYHDRIILLDSEDVYNKIIQNYFLLSHSDFSTAVIMSTSGSTGQPKYICHSYKSIFYSASIFSNSDIFKNTNRYLHILSSSFSGGRKVFYAAILNNLSISFKSKSKSVIDNIKLFSPDITALTPTILLEIIDYIKINGNDLSLKKVICGGAFLNKEDIDFLSLNNIKVFNVYGLTETASLVSYNSEEFFNENSVGKINDEIDFFIDQDNVLHVKGNMIFQGYWRNKSIQQFNNDYFCTNDICYIDNDGFLYIKGRKDRNVKNNKGEWVNLDILKNELGKSYNLNIQLFYTNNKIDLHIYSNEIPEDLNLKSFLEENGLLLNEIKIINKKVRPYNQIIK